MSNTVTLEESLVFAALSGDFNPLHVDPILARRLKFGGSVVHGVHILLAALDAALAAGTAPVRMTFLKALFVAPIHTDSPFDVSIQTRDVGGVAIIVGNGAQTSQEILVDFAPNEARDDRRLDDSLWQRTEPREVAFEEARGGTVPLRLARAELRRLFPHVADRLPGMQVSCILAATAVVGMRCPGLHSVFADLSLEFEPGLSDGPAELAYRITQTRPGFRMIRLALSGPDASGNATALFRSPPVRQASFAEVRSRIPTGAFRDQRALVIGGSRGLGEVLAKVVAAGSGDVLITYFHGRSDADSIANEIKAFGGSCRIARYEVETGINEISASAPEGWCPTHVYYFGTPQIVANRGPWDAALYARFCRFYVDGFAALVERSERDFPKTAKRRRYFYPSTTYVGATPPGFLEYAAAKAAGETLCRGLNDRFKGSIEIEAPRLPRLLTDQTVEGDAAGSPSAYNLISRIAFSLADPSADDRSCEDAVRRNSL